MIVSVKLCISVGNNDEYITMCNFGGRINQAKKPGLKERQCIQGRAETLKLNLSTFTNFNFCFTAGRFAIFTGQV